MVYKKMNRGTVLSLQNFRVDSMVYFKGKSSTSAQLNFYATELFAFVTAEKY